MQGDIFQSAPNRGIDALPGAPDPAQTFDTAPTGSSAAFGDGDRPFKYIEDLCRGDFLGPARKTITTLRTA